MAKLFFTVNVLVHTAIESKEVIRILCSWTFRPEQAEGISGFNESRFNRSSPYSSAPSCRTKCLMVKIERQSSVRLANVISGGLSAYWIVLIVSSCFFGLWGYLIGSSLNNIGNNDGNIASRATSTLRGLKDGWSPIHVFYGDQSTLKRSSSGWYSQVKQDEVVSALFRNKKNGFFVDLASNDAVTLSNTFALEERHNWDGESTRNHL